MHAEYQVGKGFPQAGRIDSSVPAEEIDHDGNSETRKITISVKGMSKPCKNMQLDGVSSFIERFMQDVGLIDWNAIVIVTAQQHDWGELLRSIGERACFVVVSFRGIDTE